MKHVFAIILVLAIALTLCACGGGSTPVSATPAEGTPQESPTNSVEKEAEIEETVEEEAVEIEAEEVLIQDGVLLASINDFMESYQITIDSIDDNITVETSGLSTSEISGYLRIGSNPCGIIYFYNNKGASIGGKGNNGSVIHEIRITNMIMNSSGNLVSDAYQQSVIYPAAMMAIDKSFSYDDALSLLDKLDGANGAIVVNGVSYSLAPTFSDSPNLLGLIISVES